MQGAKKNADSLQIRLKPMVDGVRKRYSRLYCDYYTYLHKYLYNYKCITINGFAWLCSRLCDGKCDWAANVCERITK